MYDISIRIIKSHAAHPLVVGNIEAERVRELVESMCLAWGIPIPEEFKNRRGSTFTEWLDAVGVMTHEDTEIIAIVKRHEPIEVPATGMASPEAPLQSVRHERS